MYIYTLLLSNIYIHIYILRYIDIFRNYDAVNFAGSYSSLKWKQQKVKRTNQDRLSTAVCWDILTFTYSLSCFIQRQSNLLSLFFFFFTYYYSILGFYAWNYKMPSFGYSSQHYWLNPFKDLRQNTQLSHF